MDNALPLHVECLGFETSETFFFFRSPFVLFLFLKRRTYRKRFATSIYKEKTSHLTVNLKKCERTS